MKLNLDTLVNTHIGFPSEWTCDTDKGKKIKISYRYGVITFYNDRDEMIHRTDGPDGSTDIGGSLEEKDLILVLEREGFLPGDDE